MNPYELNLLTLDSNNKTSKIQGGFLGTVILAASKDDPEILPDGNTTGPGPTGEPGNPGPAGATGPAGPAGPTGPQGPTGNQGAIGETGASGDLSPPTGAQGETGASPIGPPGDTGDPSAPGPQGVQGTIGSQGFQGMGVETFLELDDTVDTYDDAGTLAFGQENDGPGRALRYNNDVLQQILDIRRGFYGSGMALRYTSFITSSKFSFTPPTFTGNASIDVIAGKDVINRKGNFNAAQEVNLCNNNSYAGSFTDRFITSSLDCSGAGSITISCDTCSLTENYINNFGQPLFSCSGVISGRGFASKNCTGTKTQSNFRLSDVRFGSVDCSGRSTLSISSSGVYCNYSTLSTDTASISCKNSVISGRYVADIACIGGSNEPGSFNLDNISASARITCGTGCNLNLPQSVLISSGDSNISQSGSLGIMISSISSDMSSSVNDRGFFCAASNGCFLSGDRTQCMGSSNCTTGLDNGTIIASSECTAERNMIMSSYNTNITKVDPYNITIDPIFRNFVASSGNINLYKYGVRGSSLIACNGGSIEGPTTYDTTRYCSIIASENCTIGPARCNTNIIISSSNCSISNSSSSSNGIIACNNTTLSGVAFIRPSMAIGMPKYSVVTAASGRVTVNDLRYRTKAFFSDRNLKKDIIVSPEYPDLLNKLLELKIYKFQFNNEIPLHVPHMGFIAQEVQNIFPEMVISKNHNQIWVERGSDGKWIHKNTSIPVELDKISKIVENAEVKESRFSYVEVEDSKPLSLDNQILASILWESVQEVIKINNLIENNTSEMINNLEGILTN